MRKNTVIAVLGYIFLSVVASVVMIEWMSGCGETYVTAQGVRHVGECVFIK